MKIKNIACLVFSPTGGCLKMIKSIKTFLEDYNVEIHNITKPQIRETFIEIPKKIDYVIIAFPIYADTLPDIVTGYLNKLLISNVPVSLIAGYGNIHVGKALFNAKTIIEAKGNVVCSACAIVTAHSYNGNKLQIAVNEPTSENLKALNQFMLKSINKAKQASQLSMRKTELPEGHIRLLAKAPQKLFPQIFIKQPKAIQGCCNHCNVCMNMCPTGAIDDKLNIDDGKCIRCLACVKYCTKNARLFETRTRILTNTLMKEGKELKKNVFYI